MTIQLVLPMAGRGQRFASAGYATPKPLLPIHGLPMFEVVLNNLISPLVSRVIVIAQSEFGVAESIGRWGDRVGMSTHVLEIDWVTDGPAATVGLAQHLLEKSMPVVVGNSDQYVTSGMGDFHAALLSSDCAGQIMTMGDDDPKWSYVRLNEQGLVAEVREKHVISSIATVGIYGYQSAELLSRALQLMFERGERIEGEFYLAPSYNYLIEQGLKVGTVHVGPVDSAMFGLGIPEDYRFFLESPVSRTAVLRVQDGGGGDEAR